MTGESLSFGGVADRYDRARPDYPPEAVDWLVGPQQRRVVELGAGTGKLTQMLVERDHLVLATDPDERMLSRLRRSVPDAFTVVGVAERIPVAHRSVDVVVAAQAFHWFDLPTAVPEIARLLRRDGVLALVWNQRDESIPWVKKLGRLIGNQDQRPEPTADLAGFEEFGEVEEQTFRHWQLLHRDELIDLAASRSNVAVMADEERDALLEQVGELYDEYGRGPEGMMLPYVTRCFRAVVTPVAPPPAQPDPTPGRSGPADPLPGEPTQPLSRADLARGLSGTVQPPRSQPPDYDGDGIRLIDFS